MSKAPLMLMMTPPPDPRCYSSSPISLELRCPLCEYNLGGWTALWFHFNRQHKGWSIPGSAGSWPGLASYGRWFDSIVTREIEAKIKREKRELERQRREAEKQKIARQRSIQLKARRTRKITHLLHEGLGPVFNRDFASVLLAAHGGIAVLPYQREVPFSQMWRQPLKWDEIVR